MTVESSAGFPSFSSRLWTSAVPGVSSKVPPLAERWESGGPGGSPVDRHAGASIEVDDVPMEKDGPLVMTNIAMV